VAIAAADAADAENAAYHDAIAGLLWGITEVPGLAINMGAVFADVIRPYSGRIRPAGRTRLRILAQAGDRSADLIGIGTRGQTRLTRVRFVVEPSTAICVRLPGWFPVIPFHASMSPRP
jgi:hypothetical protein